jgi:hypothetical protein
MKATYGYATKSAARAMLKETIKTVFPKQQQREHLQVATLLGHEDHELKEIWDPLGVKREHIYVIEDNATILAHQRSQAWGVKLPEQPMDALSALVRSRQQFDIINIDETAPFGQHQRDTLRNIAQHGLLGRAGVLATWYQAKRDDENAKRWLLNMQKTCPRPEWGELERMAAASKIMDRSDMISRFICGIFLDGKTNFSEHPFIEEFGLATEYRERFHDMIKQDPGIYLVPPTERNKKRYDQVSAEQLIRQQNICYNRQEGPDVVKKQLKEILASLGTHPEKIPLFAEMLFYTRIQPYFSKLQQRAKYVGDRGTPMIVDINYFKKEPLEDTISLEKRPDGTYQLYIERTPAKLLSVVQQFRDWRARAAGDGTLSPRIYLGSSYRGRSAPQEPEAEANNSQRSPPQDPPSQSEDISTEKLDKASAIDFLKSGCTPEEILHAYPGNFSIYQLRAYKAHITMGTYGETSKRD